MLRVFTFCSILLDLDSLYFRFCCFLLSPGIRETKISVFSARLFHEEDEEIL